MNSLVFPWWVKIVAKVALSRLPFAYHVWKRFGIFAHGAMESPRYAYKVYVSHFRRLSVGNREMDPTVLELGPGDSLFSAILGRSFGASRTILVDAGRYAQEDMDQYREMSEFLAARQLPFPDLSGIQTVDEMLQFCDAIYYTSGLESLRQVDSASIDLVWSQAVLEHIPRTEFLDTIREMRRIIKPDGVGSHRVDLSDHLGGALNNLRFSEKVWESGFMSGSGFYTNRIRFREMLGLFQEAGFDVEVLAVDRWDRIPTPRSKLAEPFRQLDDDDLRVSGFNVELRPA